MELPQAANDPSLNRHVLTESDDILAVATQRFYSLSEQYSFSICTDNHTGPFCYDCVPGTTKRGEHKLCTSCTPEIVTTDRGRVTGILFLSVILSGLVLFGVFYYTHKNYQILQGRSKLNKLESSIIYIVRTMDISIPIQIVISYLQVISGMSVTFKDILPAFFIQLRQVFSILALDFVNILDFGCALDAQNHFASLLLSTCLPILACTILFSTNAFLQWKLAKNDNLLRQEFKNATFTVFLVIMFLVYPSCSNRILATFSCRPLDDGTSIISIDPSISCQSEVYAGYMKYTIFMTVVYPAGIPILYSILLFRERRKLNPFRNDQNMARIADIMRANNRDIRYLRFLWLPYKPRYFWFEIFELLRKLAQTSIVVFVAPGSSPQIVFQMLTTMISVVVLNTAAPYVDSANTLLALIAQWSLFAIVLITLLIKFNLSAGILVAEYDQNSLDNLLTTLFFAVPVAVFLRITRPLLRRAYERMLVYKNIFVAYASRKLGYILQYWKQLFSRFVVLASTYMSALESYSKHDENDSKEAETEIEKKQRRRTRKTETSGKRRGTTPKKEIKIDRRRKTLVEFQKLENLPEPTTEEEAIDLISRFKRQFASVDDDLSFLLKLESKAYQSELERRLQLQYEIDLLEEELKNLKIAEVFGED
jgi:hypothetical protein